MLVIFVVIVRPVVSKLPKTPPILLVLPEVLDALTVALLVSEAGAKPATSLVTCPNKPPISVAVAELLETVVPESVETVPAGEKTLPVPSCPIKPPTWLVPLTEPPVLVIL